MPRLFGLAVDTSLAGLVLLKTLLGGVLHRLLTLDDLLDRSVDLGPVVENVEGNVLAGAVGDEV